jgi:ribose 1,5-bisphosphokinase
MTSRGTLVAVVGASGVGKDSLISYAAARLPAACNVRFVRRVITRPAESGGEDHDFLPLYSFEQVERGGGFAVSWSAHGLRYGVPASVADFVEGGGLAVLNGSRSALAAIAEAFPRMKVVEVNANAEVLEKRLMNRGREAPADVARRLERRIQDHGLNFKSVKIDNSGKLPEAGEKFLSYLTALLSEPAERGAVDAPMQSSKAQAR